MTVPSPDDVPKFPVDASFLAAIAAQMRADRSAPPAVKALADAVIEIGGEHGAHCLIAATVDYIAWMAVAWATLDPDQRDKILDAASRSFAFGFNKVESRRLSGFGGHPDLTVVEGGRA